MKCAVNVQIRLALLGAARYGLASHSSAALADTAAEKPLEMETVQVTATRIPLPIENLPALISVVNGAELEPSGRRWLRASWARASTTVCPHAASRQF